MLQAGDDDACCFNFVLSSPFQTPAQYKCFTRARY